MGRAICDPHPAGQGISVREISRLTQTVSLEDAGLWMYDLITELYPICRSMTGDGVRRTLEIIGRANPLQVHEVPSGTSVFDWTVPKEWNIRDAFIKDSRGKKIVDWAHSNLHVVGYSVPVRRVMSLAELKKHLFSLPGRPDWIPYRTSYFKEDWGFCLSHEQLTGLEEGSYEVCIDSSLHDGHMTYGELLLKGESSDEVLISTHVCHPSLCNDNLSGIAMAVQLANLLRPLHLRYSYRFLFIPATLGSIAWLSMNRERAVRVKHGLVLAGVGDPGKTTYKKSRRGDAEIDRAACHVLERSREAFEIFDFVPYGYDERQYCSPGFNLPVGVLARTPHGKYPEYHTSADNLSLVQPTFLANSLFKCLSILNVLENNAFCTSKNPQCEPQLGRRGIFRSFSERVGNPDAEMALLWVLNYSDGDHSLLDIAERSGLTFDAVRHAADVLLDQDLLSERG
jgi:aminopeptidase-like protein